MLFLPLLPCMLSFRCLCLHIVLYCTVLCCIVRYCILLYSIVLCCILLYCTVLCCIARYSILFYCTVLYCIVLYCFAFVLCCIVSYHIVVRSTLLQDGVLGCPKGGNDPPFPQVFFSAVFWLVLQDCAMKLNFSKGTFKSIIDLRSDNVSSKSVQV